MTTVEYYVFYTTILFCVIFQDEETVEGEFYTNILKASIILKMNNYIIIHTKQIILHKQRIQTHKEGLSQQKQIVWTKISNWS